jgi:hypothetical protein
MWVAQGSKVQALPEDLTAVAPPVRVVVMRALAAGQLIFEPQPQRMTESPLPLEAEEPVVLAAVLVDQEVASMALAEPAARAKVVPGQLNQPVETVATQTVAAGAPMVILARVVPAALALLQGVAAAVVATTVAAVAVPMWTVAVQTRVAAAVVHRGQVRPRSTRWLIPLVIEPEPA